MVYPYGENELVHIVDNPGDFILAAEKELSKKRKTTWLKKVDCHDGIPPSSDGTKRVSLQTSNIV